MTAITFDSLWKNVHSAMESLNPEVVNAFKRRVDPDGLWDDKPKAIIDSFHNTHYYWLLDNSFNQRMRIPLTYGHLELAFLYTKGDDGVNTLKSGHFRYYVPRIGDHNKLVVGNKINRSFPANMFNSPEAFSKGFRKTFEKIAEAVLGVFDSSKNLDRNRFNPANYYKGLDPNYVPYIIGAHRIAANIGRLRMNTKIMQDRCEFMGLDASLAKRLNEMANEMADIYARVGATQPHIALMCDRTDYSDY